MTYLGEGLDSIWRRSDSVTRSISSENPTGEPGKGSMAGIGEGIASHAAEFLGRGWKVNPYSRIEPGEEFVLADIAGEGIIQHIWMTPAVNWRRAILRFYWDGCESPSVECPAGDFFGMGWNTYAPLVSAPVCVNPGSALNCYWPMPFRSRCRITVENLDSEGFNLYYQIDYALCKLPEEASYFHARFHRSNPLPYMQPHLILDTQAASGQYVGTYLAWGAHNNGWWGEGEVKFYMDTDMEFPTICTTGTEDYFCGSYNFENQELHQYETFTTPYAGLCQVIQPDGLYQSQMRFGMYRWHTADPVRFRNRLKVDIQALGWRDDNRYLPLRDDIASTAFWYQDEPSSDPPQKYTVEELGVY